MARTRRLGPAARPRPTGDVRSAPRPRAAARGGRSRNVPWSGIGRSSVVRTPDPTLGGRQGGRFPATTPQSFSLAEEKAAFFPLGKEPIFLQLSLSSGTRGCPVGGERGPPSPRGGSSAGRLPRQSGRGRGGHSGGGRAPAILRGGGAGAAAMRSSGREGTAAGEGGGGGAQLAGPGRRLRQRRESGQQRRLK